VTASREGNRIGIGDGLTVRRRSSGRGDGGAGDPVAMFIDTTTCIGCKACEVACQEWNGLPVEPTAQFGTYQTMPDLSANYWNLIKFNEIEENGPLEWLMRKDMCLHCAEPGCLLACPVPGAIVQYRNGVVEIDPDTCIGCGFCITGCPFNVPKLHAVSGKAHKCTMCSDRLDVGLGPACVKACPTGCLEFGSKTSMLDLGARRVEALKADGHAQAGVYDPAGVGGTGVIYVLKHADRPQLYGDLPESPRISPLLGFAKGPLRWLGGLFLGSIVLATVLHYLRVGPKSVPAHDSPPSGLGLIPAPLPVPRPAPSGGRRVLRYTFADRVLHWSVALTFIYTALTGLGLFFRPLAVLLALFGGGETVRVWHPIVATAFTALTLALFAKWRKDVRLGREDLAWLKAIRQAALNREERLPPAGRFNAGQKVFFIAVTLLALALFASGIPLWFLEIAGAGVRTLCVLIHDAATVGAVALVILHIYMATAATPGSFSAMLHGTVSEEWARRHHGAWKPEPVPDEELKGPDHPGGA